MMGARNDLAARLITGLCIFLGIALQIQASSDFIDGFRGIRLNLADIALPFAGLFILFSLLRRTSALPAWALRGSIIWPVVLTGLILLSFINGYFALGYPSSWAVANKLVGWFVLMAFFALGAWITTNGPERTTSAFIKSLSVAFLILTIIGSMAIFLHILWPDQFMPLFRYQLKALMGNRNAYALLLIFVVCLFFTLHLSGRRTIPLWVLDGFWICLPILMMLNASRAAWITIPALIFIMGLYHRKKTALRILILIAIGITPVFLLYKINPKIVFRENQLDRIGILKEYATTENPDTQALMRKGRNYKGDVIRLRVFQDAISMWKEKPFTGTGLGTFIEDQKEKYTEPNDIIDVIDSTPLWLLTETGVIGLSLFSAFYIMCLWSLWRNGKAMETDLDVLRMAVFFGLIGFAAMSLLHELLYSRYLWFMLGLSLAVPKMRPA